MDQSIFSLITPLLLIPPIYLLYWRIRLKKLRSYKSDKSGVVEVLQKYNGEKLLTIKPNHQGVSIESPSIRKSYWYAVSKEVVNFTKNRKNAQVLMLGLGANTIPSLIHQMNPKIGLTVVEFDEAVIRACSDYFNLDETPMDLIIMDVYRWVKNNTKKFDSIIVDIFTDEDLYSNIKSSQPTFIKQLLKHLKKNPQVIFNRPLMEERNSGDIEKLINFLKSLFKKVKVVQIKDPRGYRNKLVIAT